MRFAHLRSSMALSVCAFVVSPAPATSFISLPLCRTSRQWRCVSSARQQGEPVRRSRKRLHVGRGACRSGSDVQPGTSRNAPDSKTNYATAFFDSIGQERDIGRGTAETRVVRKRLHPIAQLRRMHLKRRARRADAAVAPAAATNTSTIITMLRVAFPPFLTPAGRA